MMQRSVHNYGYSATREQGDGSRFGSKAEIGGFQQVRCAPGHLHLHFGDPAWPSNRTAPNEKSLRGCIQRLRDLSVPVRALERLNKQDPTRYGVPFALLWISA
jgi:hypothetical protein